jgi:hypothetical protein
MLSRSASMTIYYLYVKTHNKTGLKYLGQTSKQDPYTYMGSGKNWIPHLRMHGFDVSTTIIRECKTKQELNEVGKANLGRKHTPETLEKKRRAMINYWREKKSKLS